MMKILRECTIHDSTEENRFTVTSMYYARNGVY